MISVLINEKHLSGTLTMTIKGKGSQLTKQLPEELNRYSLLLNGTLMAPSDIFIEMIYLEDAIILKMCLDNIFILMCV